VTAPDHTGRISSMTGILTVKNSDQADSPDSSRD
jgi:hypothetical protein